MNILIKLLNKLEYAYYVRRRDTSSRKMEKHMDDDDARRWQKWAVINFYSRKKCSELQLNM